MDKPVARPLPTRGSTNTEETRKDIHDSRIRTHVPGVCVDEDRALDRAATVAGNNQTKIIIQPVVKTPLL
jgi:hypothetical protein